MMLIRYCMYSCALQDKNCAWKLNFAKNCGNGKRNRNPNHKKCIINFLLLLAYRDYAFPACGTTALLHTFLSIDQRIAVAFSITYRNLYLNIPHKLIMIGTILICIVPGLIFFMSWTYILMLIHHTVKTVGEVIGNVIYNHNSLSYLSSS